MILDLTLQENAYFLKIHKNFFQNKSLPLPSFQLASPLTEKYSYLGVFQLGQEMFGFAGCFKLYREENPYFIYRFNFPELANDIAMRRMLLTLYLSTYYVVEQMFFAKEFFSETVWDDQALSFIVFNGGEHGYPLGGQLYPWFKKKLQSLTDEDLVRLNKYVSAELQRVYAYFYKQELAYSQISIKRESFFIQVNMGGRWIAWQLSRDLNKPEEFDSHNIDFHSDQELCFAAVIAMNTWLRNTKKAE